MPYSVRAITPFSESIHMANLKVELPEYQRNYSLDADSYVLTNSRGQTASLTRDAATALAFTFDLLEKYQDTESGRLALMLAFDSAFAYFED